MKTHSGFISNSSSTSFILKLTDYKKCECCGHVTSDINNILNREFEDNKLIASGYDEIYNYVCDNYGEFDEDMKFSAIKTINEHKGENLIMVEVSIHDTDFNIMIDEGKIVTCLWSSGN